MASPCRSANSGAGKRCAQEEALQINQRRGHPQCCPCSRIQSLLRDEAVFRSRSDQIAFEDSAQSPQLSLWRDRVAQWYYNVVDHLNSPRDVVFLAMNFLDRISAHNGAIRTISKEEYELTSTTCIFLAMRVSSTRTDLKVADFLQVCESTLQVAQIQATGAKLLQTLSLKTPMTNPSAFAKAYLQLLQPFVSPEAALSLLENSMYLIELSVCDHYLAKVPPSKLAFAAVVACVQSALDGPQVDFKAQEAFYKALDEETSLSISSSDIQPYYLRLLANYHQNREGITTSAPVLIQDEPDISTYRSPRESSESLTNLLPWTPTVSDLCSVEMTKPSKRSKLC